MISSLVRWFGRRPEGGPSKHDVRVPKRYKPRVNALETRMLPGGLSGGVIANLGHTAPAHVSVNAPSHEIVYGSTINSVGDGMHFTFATARAGGIGEEIPQ